MSPLIEISASERVDGPAVLLLHGFLLSPAVWRLPPLVDALADRDVVAAPLPGHSPWSSSEDDLKAVLGPEALADAYLAAMRRRFGDRPFRIVGHSTGALIALQIARRAPQRVDGVFLVGALGCGRARARTSLWTRLAQAPVVGPVAARTALGWWLSDVDTFASGVATALARAETRADLPPHVLRDLRASDAAALYRVFAWLSQQSMLDLLGEVRVPVCAMLCGADPVIAPAHQLDVVRRLPSARAVLVDAGHLPMLTQPHVFAATLRAWLNDGGAASHVASPAAVIPSPSEVAVA